MRKLGIVCLLALSAFARGAAAAPFVIDNPRVSIRDIILTSKGELVRPDSTHPFVLVLLARGVLRISRGGRVSSQMYAPGNAIYGAKGVDETIQSVSGHQHLVLVSLKEDTPKPPLINSSHFPLAFPRPGSEKVLDNDRVVVWNYSWRPNRSTPMHFHDKDVVVVYQGEGALASVTPDGKVTVNAYHPGNIKFNAANRIHSEKLVQGSQSAIVIELK